MQTIILVYAIDWTVTTIPITNYSYLLGPFKLLLNFLILDLHLINFCCHISNLPLSSMYNYMRFANEINICIIGGFIGICSARMNRAVTAVIKLHSSPSSSHN